MFYSAILLKLPCVFSVTRNLILYLHYTFPESLFILLDLIVSMVLYFLYLEVSSHPFIFSPFKYFFQAGDILQFLFSNIFNFCWHVQNWVLNSWLHSFSTHWSVDAILLFCIPFLQKAKANLQFLFPFLYFLLGISQVFFFFNLRIQEFLLGYDLKFLSIQSGTKKFPPLILPHIITHMGC